MQFTLSENGNRQLLSSGKIWESRVGYSRAVRLGNAIHVAGTMGYDADGNYPESAAEQTENAILFIQAALEQIGSGLADVVRTRIYVTSIDDQDQVGAAHGKYFGDIRPAATMVEVSALAAPEAKVEIEVEALTG